MRFTTIGRRGAEEAADPETRGHRRAHRGTGAVRATRRVRSSVRSRVGTAVLVVAAVGLTGVAVLNRDGFTPTRFTVTPSSAWLPSFKVGQVALVDGASSDTLAKVEVVRASARLAVVQSGSTAFVLNQDKGTLTRVDGGTLDTVNATPFGASTSLQPFAGSGSLFLYDRVRGALATLDTQTLSIRKRTSLAPAANPYSAVVDSGGHLWVIAGNDGSVNRYDGYGNRLSAGSVTDPTKAQLALANGHPIVIDQAGGGGVRPVDIRTGKLGKGTCIAGAGHRLWSAGSPTRERVYFSDGTAGALLVSDVEDDTCDTFVDVAAPGSLLGPPLEAGDKVLVPDWTSSSVAIVDTLTWKVVKVKIPVPRRNQFDLVKSSAFVFYNDPNSENAGVISLDGKVTPTKKYDPTDSKGDLKAYRKPTPTSTRNPPTKSATPKPPTQSSTPDRPTPSQDGSAAPRPQPTGPVALATEDPAARKIQIYVDPPPSPELGKPYVFQVRPVGSRRIVSAEWALGDGDMSTGSTVRHTYTKAGPFAVRVEAVMSDGSIAVDEARIIIHAAPVVEIVSISPTRVVQGEPVVFSATFRNGTPKSYLWTVIRPAPDGRSMDTSTEPNPSFTFDTPTADTSHPYTVSLTIDGETSAAISQEVLVGPTKPGQAQVDCTPDRSVVGLQVTCTGEPSEWVTSWDWAVYDSGGRLQYTRSTASKQYVLPSLRAGEYRVTAVATNETGSGTAGEASVLVAETVLDQVTCSPAPAFVGVTEECTVRFNGWDDAFTSPTWQLLDKGVPLDDPQPLMGASSRLRFSKDFVKEGTYTLRVTYGDTFGITRTIGGGQIVVAPARRSLTVTVPAHARLSSGPQTCEGRRTCTWVFGEGDTPTILAAVDEGYRLTGWSGGCPKTSGDSCSLTIESQDLEVALEIGKEVTLTTELRRYESCEEGASSLKSRAGFAAFRAENPVSSPPKTSASPKASPPKTSASPSKSVPPQPKCGPAWELPKLKVRADNVESAEGTCQINGTHMTRTCSFVAVGAVTWHIDVLDSDVGVTWSGCTGAGSNTKYCQIQVNDGGQDVHLKASWKNPGEKPATP